MIVGLLHPGEMGSALGSALRKRGVAVLWASAGRSPATAQRAAAADLSDGGSAAELARRCDVIFSVCPPHGAVDVARSVAGFKGVFVDCNAVSPATARAIVALIEGGGGRYVDGGIVGPPPGAVRSTRLYLSGSSAGFVADLVAGTGFEGRVLSDRVGDASALKMAYAAWSKGRQALLLAVRALARAEGVEAALLREWSASWPDLEERSLEAARSVEKKGWRWAGELEEIASTFESAGLPDGFHRAGAEIFRRPPEL